MIYQERAKGLLEVGKSISERQQEGKCLDCFRIRWSWLQEGATFLRIACHFI